tara:strand:+ start:43 stop:252 length:210 start_codon:yes stop_codon:yes gene_type:complete
MNHYNVNFTQYNIDGKLLPAAWVEVKAMSFDDAKNQVIKDFCDVAEICSILLFKRGVVPHDISSGCCSS